MNNRHKANSLSTKSTECWGPPPHKCTDHWNSLPDSAVNEAHRIKFKNLFANLCHDGRIGVHFMCSILFGLQQHCIRPAYAVDALTPWQSYIRLCSECFPFRFLNIFVPFVLLTLLLYCWPFLIPIALCNALLFPDALAGTKFEMISPLSVQ